MSDDLLKQFGHPQFTPEEVRMVCGLSSGALKGILDRKQIDLGSDHFPGSGRRRLFSASNILKIRAANLANELGLPLRFANALGEFIEQRAVEGILGKSILARTPYAIAIDSTNPDDPIYIGITNGNPSSELPAAYRFIDVDRVVDETFEKLEALIEDRPLRSE